MTTEIRDGVLNGEKVDVQHGATVAAFAVVVEDAVAFIAADAPGVVVTPVEGVDPAAAACTVTFTDVQADHVVTGDAAIARAFAIGAVAVTAEGLGAASAALDLAIEYSLERKQFGRPIGSFQALQHVMADAHIDREAAWSTVLYAAAALDEELPDAAEAARIAKAYGARASRSVVEAALQVLGGIAFTWEHDVHLLQRRVLSTERRFGDAIMHEDRLGESLAARTTAVHA
jgi:alkylation response protein AidB-like acyl-CoA dehydrogenase